MTKVHLARERAERLTSTLSSIWTQLTDEIDALNDSLFDLKGEEDATPVEAIVRAAEQAERGIIKTRGIVLGELNRWPIPEMPPLDLSNVPDVVFYPLVTTSTPTPNTDRGEISDYGRPHHTEGS